MHMRQRARHPTVRGQRPNEDLAIWPGSVVETPLKRAPMPEAAEKPAPGISPDIGLFFG
jgi:hypothetical protein